MKRQVKRFIAITRAALIVCGLLLISGCEGSKAKKEVTQTVEQAVGAETARKGQQVKEDANQSMQQEMERAEQDINAGAQGGEGAVPKESPETE